jgi:putative phosphoribosyl transferase
MPERYRDRRDAGRALAQRLSRFREQKDLLILALPRGGVPVAYEVAQALAAPLEVFLVRRLGVPWQEELAMGAIASGGITVLDSRIIESRGITTDRVNKVIEKEQRELLRREQLYRGDRSAPALAGKVVILIDDGLATGSTMRAAARAVRAAAASRIIVAVPVGPADSCKKIEDADEVICARTPSDFQAVGQWYEDFDQTTDEEVALLLQHAVAKRADPPIGGEAKLPPEEMTWPHRRS